MKEVLCYGIIPLKKKDNEWYVLLLLHSKGLYWGFPKGHAEENELPKDTSIRELKEETGLDISHFLYDKPFSEQYEFLYHEEKIFKKVFYFPAIVKGGVSLQNTEIEDFVWEPLNKAISKITFQGSQNVCRDFLKKISRGKIKLSEL